MQPERLAHFKEILLAQLREHRNNVRNDQAAALEFSDDGVKDSSDMSVMDVSKELAFRRGDRKSQIVLISIRRCCGSKKAVTAFVLAVVSRSTSGDSKLYRLHVSMPNAKLVSNKPEAPTTLPHCMSPQVPGFRFQVPGFKSFSILTLSL